MSTRALIVFQGMYGTTMIYKGAGGHPENTLPDLKELLQKWKEGKYSPGTDYFNIDRLAQMLVKTYDGYDPTGKITSDIQFIYFVVVKKVNTEIIVKYIEYFVIE